MTDYIAIETDPALRRGIYGLTELTRYLSIDGDRTLSATTVSRWITTISNSDHAARRPDYSFADLVSMLVVRNLVDLGMQIREIHEAEIHLREVYGIDRPFLSVKLKTDGVDVFYEASPSLVEQLTSANRGGQEVIRPAIAAALSGVNYHNGLAAEWSPLDGIVLDPTIQFGEPCIAETRITTRLIADLINDSGVDPSLVALSYRIGEDAVRRALQFEERLAAAA